jgi:hypothetical protein
LSIVESQEPRIPESLLYSNAVRLPSAGSAYYQPATSRQGRILELYDGRRHLYLESNISRDALLEIADSIPMEGRIVERVQRNSTTIERVEPGYAFDLKFFREPSNLPAGYSASHATVTREGGRTTSAVVRYTDRENEFAGGGIVVTAIPYERRLAASAEPFETYRSQDKIARWSPLRGELEWIDDGTYRSVRVADFRIDFALAIARSM